MRAGRLARWCAVNLDLDELLDDWLCPRDEICARLIRGDDGARLVQLRVDLGLLQMFPEGRPDGRRYRGMPTACDYFQHEFRVGREPTVEDWHELHRELQQYNYRRLAYASLAEQALRNDERTRAAEFLGRALRDIEHCLTILAQLRENEEEWDQPLAILLPTLVFNRARLRTQLRTVQSCFDEAVEEAETGARELDEALAADGVDDDERLRNPALAYLWQLSRRLRAEHGISQTLNERLAQAVAREDFETAARLRDELRRRRREQPESPPAGESE